MIRLLPVLLTFTMLFAATPGSAVISLQKARGVPDLGPTGGFERLNAKELAREAKELWHIAEDYTGALTKFNAAVNADPEDNDVRLQRAHFFERLSTIVVAKDKAKFAARAQSDFEHIAEADPDALIAGVARDGLTRLSGEPLIEVKRVACPEPAAEAHARADSLYGANRFADAAAEYEKASAACPDQAVWWVDFADSHYGLADYEKAKELFGKALSVDPWNRDAHRFLSDTEIQLKNFDAAAHELVLAVVSDPTYEAGWSGVANFAEAMGRKSHRVYGDRKAGPANADTASWVAYGAAKAKPRDGSASALATEREAVKAALKSAPDGPGPFWSMMARAEQAGFLDEAIFIHLLNDDLAAEYPSFREEKAERLTAYVETVIIR